VSKASIGTRTRARAGARERDTRSVKKVHSLKGTGDETGIKMLPGVSKFPRNDSSDALRVSKGRFAKALFRHSARSLARARAHLARMRFLSNAREGIIELSREKHEKSVNAEMRFRERATAVLA